jgi:hypothetical protein
MSARSRAGSLGSSKVGACMKPASFFAFGILRPFEPAFFDEQGMPWDFMGRNRK